MRIPARHVFVCAVSALLAACGGGGGGSAGTGTLGVSLTDAPACGYDNVWITVTKVRAHRSGDAAETDSGWSDITLDPPRRIDLLGLQNGELEDLGQTTLPAGEYTQIRLVLDDAADANELVLSATGETVAMKTPSGQRSGLKLIHPFEVQADSEMRLVLDFDACRSIVKSGASGQYLLKPVISVIAAATGGSVSGSVEQLGPEAARVQAYASLQQLDPATGDVTVVRSTTIRADGSWLLSPVPEPSPGMRYNLVLGSPGYASVVYTGVPVAAGTTTAIPSVELAASTWRTIGGAVSPAGGAVVRALQNVVDEAGDTDDVVIEAAYTNADDASGAYQMQVPTGVARVAPYVATSPVWSDADNAGIYVIQATRDGTVKTAPADIGAADQTVDFAF